MGLKIHLIRPFPSTDEKLWVIYKSAPPAALWLLRRQTLPRYRRATFRHAKPGASACCLLSCSARSRRSRQRRARRAGFPNGPSGRGNKDNATWTINTAPAPRNTGRPRLALVRLLIDATATFFLTCSNFSKKKKSPMHTSEYRVATRRHTPQIADTSRHAHFALFGALVSDAPSALSTPLSAAGGKPSCAWVSLCAMRQGKPDAIRHAG